MKNISRFILSVVLIALYIAFAISSLGLAPIELVFNRWWTLLIILSSIYNIIFKRNNNGWLISLVLGLALLI